MKNKVTSIDNSVKIENVLISVSDKSGLDSFIPELVKINPDVRIFSTGGTFTKIEEILGKESENLISVSEYTGQPEMQGGLVKTLDFKIYLGLLSETYNQAHVKDLERTGGAAIDMVIVNLYPFKETVASEGCTLESARANIDIGGPCMVRASAKNFLRVASVCDPSDYSSIIEELKVSGGKISFHKRWDLAKKAFKHTADYDTAISNYLPGINDKDAALNYNFMDEDK
ncbi:MAG: hypothetical protein JEY99_00440 [Spirochaetales bacterium]|nr:hypothetical protein [Spirochaetales bacterium]